ncbi:MAG: DNA polymerase III subunit gamma and tau [Actinobacteria bacterium]|uniref:DNA-directed DNA polymerase n=1 Tax=freshwater metagenome TaxID=449393 RepID=A0A6J6TYV0_9ZZZZ|nr:DNA polymerase III subunit gamma and tau [Actinomycetota bacterium]MSX24356.1 DNA polymerase III subunit gamma and tau [Actinomycetota bacterium]MSY57530.1 DNA polymerase III subunit gamma and tau [Actinomycetota bacterium]MTB00987.1 DNA polymerase III subunit gamma and tau [Actinomycetota bacterium]
MSLALYRKYRPSLFADVIGQEHVTVPLSNALESGRIHHAYLFSGPRGCGKTSSARIMARSLNCEKGPTPNPCGECQSCKDLVANGPGSLDVIELDAATHGLVDDARDLRDKAFFAPVNSQYKIYIIDEAHQLGPGAANALLKVVEEPPPHVIFIFATTEPEKLISTIRSRTHHYPFRLVPPGILTAHLEKICNSEGVKVAKGVLPLVVRASGGSVRDALSVLGQLLAGAGKEGVSYDIAIQLLGFTDSALLDDAIDALAAHDGATLFKTVDRVIESGHDPRRFASDLLERLRDLMIVDALPAGGANAILREVSDDQLERMRTQAQLIGSAGLSRAADIAAEGLTQMRGATAPRLMLELICGRMLLPLGDKSERGLLVRVERLERADSLAPMSAPSGVATPPKAKPITTAPAATTAVVIPPVVEKQAEVQAEVPKAAAVARPTGTTDIAGLRRLWPDVIEDVKKRRRLTWSLLSTSAQILAVDDSALTIAIVNAGARDSFLRSGSDEILRQAFIDVVGLDRKIEVVVDPSINPNTPQARAVRVDESPSDGELLSGQALLAKELGAQFISETPRS